ncbi:hypothetical protein Adt_29569 [Abeliophyllum distichum]|uniref:Uncharacterized protein n=1 Tax=Abeliophyllum distichum TaxID=126358 RepID=A0ABD1R8V3_9LAMI
MELAVAIDEQDGGDNSIVAAMSSPVTTESDFGEREGSRQKWFTAIGRQENWEVQTVMRSGVSWSRTRSRRLSRQYFGWQAQQTEVVNLDGGTAAVGTQQDRQQADSTVGSTEES